MCVCVCAFVWYIICLCVSRHRGGHKIWRIITRKKVGTQMKGLVLILERTWQLAWMFYFLRIVCFAYKGFHFLMNFDCSKDGAPSACRGEDKKCVNYLETEEKKGDVGCMWPLQRAPYACQITNKQREMTDMQRYMKMTRNKEKNTAAEAEAETPGSYISPAKKLQIFLLLHIMRECRILWHRHTHIHTFR